MTTEEKLEAARKALESAIPPIEALLRDRRPTREEYESAKLAKVRNSGR